MAVPKKSNASPSINIDITGALFTLRIQYEFIRTQCKEGATDANVYRRTPLKIDYAEIIDSYLHLCQNQHVSIHNDIHIYFLSFLLQDFLSSDSIRCYQHIQSMGFRVVLCAFPRASDRQFLDAVYRSVDLLTF